MLQVYAAGIREVNKVRSHIMSLTIPEVNYDGELLL